MLINIKEYHRPGDVKEALLLLNRPDINSRVLAGGSYLSISGNGNIEALVDISGLGFSYIKRNRSGLAIGATTYIQDMVESPAIKSFAGGIIHDCVKRYSSLLIRNVSTIGGNILWPRPWSDTTPVLLALGASITVQGLNRKEVMAVENLLVKNPQTVLKNRIITEIFIPTPKKNTRTKFIKLTQTDFDVAFLSTAVCINLDNKKNVVDARLVLGAVRGQPFRLTTAESVLKGQPFSKESISQAIKCAKNVQTFDEPRASKLYKQKIIPVLLKRALESLT